MLQNKQHSANVCYTCERLRNCREILIALMESTLTPLIRSGDILTDEYNRSVSSSSGADILLNAYYTGHV